MLQYRKKRYGRGCGMLSYEEYKACTLCPRMCGVDRTAKRGRCRAGSEAYAVRAALHAWEEPSISGKNGSGTIFFSGCSLGCVYCQNRAISRDGLLGKPVSCEAIADAMFRLADMGAHNINFVTPTHFAPTVAEAVKNAKERGFSLPVVYNTSSYERVEILRKMQTTVDIFLADFKYMSPRLAREYSDAEDYPTVAKAAIAEMVRATGEPVFSKDGLLLRGTVVRVLLLPGALIDAKRTVKYLHKTYGDKIYLSLMRQYTPPAEDTGYPVLSRRVTAGEYKSLVDYAVSLGVVNAYTQEDGVAEESFIPSFDGSGI